MKFTFDGHGVNDANDEYKSRVATLTEPYKNAEVGNLLAAAPELLKNLQRSLQYIVCAHRDAKAAGMSQDILDIALRDLKNAEAAIEKAT